VLGVLDAVATLGDAAAVVGGDVAQEVQHLVDGAIADGVDGELRVSGEGLEVWMLGLQHLEAAEPVIEQHSISSVGASSGMRE
jgi:hypothetical protein